MNESDVFNFYNKDQAVYSPYIPFISFSSQEQKELAELYILNEAEFFFKSILKIEGSIQSIPYFKTITWQDFALINMEYFYNNLFFDLGERDSSGKLVNKLKWGVTFDEEITPIQVAYLSSSFSGNREEARLSYSDRREGRTELPYLYYNPFPSYRKYGFITLNGEPIFYYLHFTLQEILDCLKPR